MRTPSAGIIYIHTHIHTHRYILTHMHTYTHAYAQVLSLWSRRVRARVRVSIDNECASALHRWSRCSCIVRYWRRFDLLQDNQQIIWSRVAESDACGVRVAALIVANTSPLWLGADNAQHQSSLYLLSLTPYILRWRHDQGCWTSRSYAAAACWWRDGVWGH